MGEEPVTGPGCDPRCWGGGERVMGGTRPLLLREEEARPHTKVPCLCGVGRDR